MVLPAADPGALAFLEIAGKSERNLALLYVTDAFKATFASVEQAEVLEEEAGSNTQIAKVPGISWNPMSFVSARTALIEAETCLGRRIDELIIFVDPPPGPIGLEESSPAEIEKVAMEWALAYVHLIREAQKSFMNKENGSLILIVKEASRGPLGSMAAGALFGLAEGLLASLSSANETAASFSGKTKTGTEKAAAFRFIAIKDESDSADAIARQVLRLLEDSPRAGGKIQRFTGRAGFFSR